MDWDELVANVTARHPLQAGAQPFDPGMGRVMKEWVLVPASQSDEWERLVDQAIG